jgi:shikimate dehydrogenase
MTLAGVIGWPIAHSLSPVLHRHWLEVFGISGSYVPLPVRREELSQALAGLRRAGYTGVNVTLPHKEAAFSLAHELDAAAAATCAVNLLLFQPNDRLYGRNTDVGGLAGSLRENGVDLAGKAATVLGAGGAARAAAVALASLDASEIRLVCRDIKRGQDLAASMRSITPPIKVFAWTDWPVAAQDTAILINATSGGLAGGGALELPLEPLYRQAAVCDLVYKPLETDLLKRARLRGNPTIDGLAMLMHQAVPSFEAFFGTRPEVTPALRRMLEEVLRHGG